MINSNAVSLSAYFQEDLASTHSAPRPVVPTLLLISSTDFPDFSHSEYGPRGNEKDHNGNDSFLPITNRSYPQYRLSTILNQRICPKWCSVGRTNMNNFKAK